MRTARGVWSALGLAVVAGSVLGMERAWGQPGDGGPQPAGVEAGRRLPPEPEAQPGTAPPETEPFEGRPIREIKLLKPARGQAGNLETATAVDEELARLVRNQLRSAEGQPYTAELVSSDISRLNRLGRFDSVETRVQLLADGSVTLYFLIEQQPTILAVQSVGNRAISDQDIVKSVEGLIGTPVDRLSLERSARRIEELYRTKGYYLAQVTLDQKELEETGILIFRVREGERIKVTEISFEGNTAFSPDTLRGEVKTERWFWPFRKGALDDDQLESDVALLIAFYKDRGYLDVRIDRMVQPAPNGREAVVTFVIDEGPVYTLRTLETVYLENARYYRTRAEAEKSLQAGEKILVRGPETANPEDPPAIAVYKDGIIGPAQAAGLMAIKPGDVYSLAKLKRSITALEDALGQMGYVDRRVNYRERRDPERPVVDVLVEITPRQAYKTGEVIIQGNDLTKQNVIRRQIELQPGRPLDMTALSLSEQKLTALGLFERGSVKLTPQEPDPDEPDTRDVLVEVKETNTGSFNIGAGVTSDSGVIGRVSLTQRNFDLYDTPDTVGELATGRAFRGAGQRFSIDLQPGDQVQTYSVSLADPYLLESDYSGSAALFYRDRDYDDYKEERYGGRFSLGRRFGDRWSGAVPIRVENVTIRDIPQSNPTDFFAFDESNLITGIGVSLTRTTFDNAFTPTRGAKIELGAERVGLIGGDIEFTVLKLEHQLFLTVSEDVLGRTSVLSFTTRASYIPEGSDDVPVYERFFLGGQSFRGFKFRTVSPRGVRQDTGTPSDVPIGGTWSFFFGAEFKQPLLEDVLSGVVFVDTGTVLDEIGLDDYRVSAGVGLRVAVPQLSPAPLAFDFGFPIVKQDTDRKRLFSFSIDVPF